MHKSFKKRNSTQAGNDISTPKDVKRLKTDNKKIENDECSKQTPIDNSKKIVTDLTSFTPFTQRQHVFIAGMNQLRETPYFQNVITVEGNIGSGKSTLLKGLEEMGFKVIQEPVDNIWQKYLPKLYEDPTRWGCTFQFEVFFWYQKLRDQILPDVLKKHPLVAIERSPHSSFHVFCKNLRQQNKLTDWEFDLLSRFFELTKWRPHKIIYLQAEPDKCIERIKQRNRKGECSIDTDLIRNLHDLHETFYANGDHDGCNVVTINANLDIPTVCENAKKHIHVEKMRMTPSFDNIIG